MPNLTRIKSTNPTAVIWVPFAWIPLSGITELFFMNRTRIELFILVDTVIVVARIGIVDAAGNRECYRE